MDSEFVEDEPPASPGEPVYREMPLHYGEAWLICVRRMVRSLGEVSVELIEQLLGVIHERTAVAPLGPVDEFDDDVCPGPGLPDLGGEYGLPPLNPR